VNPTPSKTTETKPTETKAKIETKASSTTISKTESVPVKKAATAGPVDLETQKVVPEASAKNTPVSMPKNDLVVKKIKVGVPYTINDILFETNSSVLSNRARFILKEFSSFLVENPTSKIMIQGHTDDLGEDSENLILSENRAKEVKAFLVSLNIKADRMSSKGFGETMPKLPNTNDKNRAENRRTDFMIEKL